ncbi:hypothetical protein CP336_18790 [Pseudomonas fluorescens]|nr:hypothetical protein CP336_18790 [Pseudomonas fluorescens]
MPMFDVENADSVRLRDCATSSDNLLKVHGKVGELDAERCEAGVTNYHPEKNKVSFLRKIISFVTDNVMKVIVGFCVGALLFYLKLK